MKKGKLVKVDIELPDELILFIALEAHKRDITFNAFVNELLADFVKKHKDVDMFPSVNTQIKSMPSTMSCGIIHFVNKENNLVRCAIERSQLKKHKEKIKKLAKYPLSEDMPMTEVKKHSKGKYDD